MAKDIDKENESRREFKMWLREVDRLVIRTFGVSLHDLPDMLTRDAFDSGSTPSEFFQDEVVPMVREEFGSELVDAIVGEDFEF